MIKMEESWKKELKNEFEKPYFKKLSEFVRSEYMNGKTYPLPKNIFRAFELCPFDKIKVVIIGQDPYHGPHQANGLCFAVSEGIKIPPSLKNIYKEISDDLGASFEKLEKAGGDLSRWAMQGVLLLNATLTVSANTPGSHQGKGWEEFTDAVIKKLSENRSNIAFMLWGNYAKKKGAVIDRSKHLVLEAQHPSPFSARSGFFGCKHFSKANEYLKKKGLKEVRWDY